MKKQILGLVLVTALTAGCATDRGRTQGQGAVVGTVTGAAAGAAIAAAATKGDPTAILIGAGAGAVTGLIAGLLVAKHVADQKEKFAREEDYLDAVITSAQQMNAQTQQYNASLQSEINTLDQDTAVLITQYNQRASTKAELHKEEKRLAAKISEAQKQLQKVNKEVDIQKSVLTKEQGQSQEHLNKLQTQVRELEQNKAELEQHINRLASIKTRVAV